MYRFLILLLTLTTFQAFSQDNATSTDKEKIPLGERLYYSGGLDFNINTNSMLLGASPSVGYKFNEVLSAGLGVTYQWLNFRLIDYDTHIYGGKAFIRGKLPANILLAAEYERVSVEFVQGNRFWQESTLAGVGYHIPQNDVVSINVFLYYNFSFNEVTDRYGTEFVPKVEVAYNF